MDGKFVRKIGRHGKGPGEYISIQDIWVDELAEEVYIREVLSGSMVGFGFNGEILGRIASIPRAGESVAVVNAHQLIDALPKILENRDFHYNSDFIKQIQGMDYEDNPVLLLYQLK
ncbi:MAG: 6-bladed beta-propeller [Bacteroidales bacterium]|nr:6-bladed beta-propeller [Bacteroidales bacterium]